MHFLTPSSLLSCTCRIKLIRFDLRISLLLCLFFPGILVAQTAPIAGFVVDSTRIGHFTPHAMIEVYVRNQSSGNPTAIEYLIHTPGDMSFTYGTNNQTGASVIVHLGAFSPESCVTYEISQIVTNNSGADTLTQSMQAGCPCLNTPLEYWIEYTHLGNGIVNFFRQVK